MAASGRSMGSRFVTPRHRRGRRSRPLICRLGVEVLEDRAMLSFTPGVEFVAGELLVGFRTGVALQDVQAFYSQFGLNELKDLDRDRGDNHPGIKQLKIAQQIDARLISLLENSPWVEYAEPNYILTASAVDPLDDPRYGELWGLNNTNVFPQSGGTPDADIDALEAWGLSEGSTEVIVGIIDSGVDYNHPDLAANMWKNPGELIGSAGVDDDGNGYVDDIYGINSITGSGDPMDDNNHGTHVAGTIGAVDNTTGVIGVSPNVKIVAAKFLNSGGSGSTADAIECFQYFNRLKNDYGRNIVITNNSWGGGAFSQALMDAMAGLDEPGMAPILHAVAAGNANSNNDAVASYPSGYNLPNIISVAATDRNDLYASFSSYGAASVDIAAPGVSILSTIPKGTAANYDNAYAFFNGTSMATPHVAGAAALIAAEYSLSAEQIKQALMFGTDDISGIGSNLSKPTLTNGRLNVHQTLLDLSETGDTTPPAAVTNLVVSGTGVNSVTLTWNPTGDDGTSGVARAYDVRYSTLPIPVGSEAAWWTAATQAVSEPRPKSAESGSPEIFRVTGLASSTTYHFAVMALDNRANDSELAKVSGSTRAAMNVFTDMFGSGFGSNWVAQSPWGTTTAVSNSPNYSATDSPSGNYSSNANTSLTSKTISLAGVKDASVSFWHRYNLESSFDFGHFEVSGNNGATWTTLASYTGANTTFHKVTHNLSAYDGNPQVKIRYRLQSDSIFKYDGWYVDDVEVGGTGTSPGPGQSGLSITDVSINEADADASGSVDAVFTVSLTAASSQDVRVYYKTANGAVNPATAGPDYVNQSGILTIPAGSTNSTITVPVKVDLLDEASETFSVNLYDASANAHITDWQGIGTIADNDEAPTLISISDPTITEGDSGTLTAIFTLTLSAPSGQPVSVSFATADGTASAASDYVARTTSTLTFLPGQTSRAIGVSVNGDLVQEPNETFFLNLTNPVSVILADVQGVGTILDNNDPATPPVKLYLSLETGGTVGGVTFADEDILTFDGTNFGMHFDGSDVGVGGLVLDAFAMIDADEILMSFTAAGSIPGLGTVDDSDIVKFTSTSLGANNGRDILLVLRRQRRRLDHQ